MSIGATIWTCGTCGTARTSVAPTLDPRYGNARCEYCRTVRVFRSSEPHAVARRTDPVTSHLAAASVRDIRSSQAEVLEALRSGPATDEEIYDRLAGIQSLSGARTRRSELVRLGFVEDSGGKKRLRSGRLSIVWQQVPGIWKETS